MMIMEKNIKKEIVNNYIKTYSPYESSSLGINVSDVIKLAKEKGCAIKDLSKADVKKLSK